MGKNAAFRSSFSAKIIYLPHQNHAELPLFRLFTVENRLMCAYRSFASPWALVVGFCGEKNPWNGPKWPILALTSHTTVGHLHYTTTKICDIQGPVGHRRAMDRLQQIILFDRNTLWVHFLYGLKWPWPPHFFVKLLQREWVPEFVVHSQPPNSSSRRGRITPSAASVPPQYLISSKCLSKPLVPFVNFHFHQLWHQNAWVFILYRDKTVFMVFTFLEDLFEGSTWWGRHLWNDTLRENKLLNMCHFINYL